MDSPSHNGEKGAVDVARRVYLGNVPYATSPNEVEDALRDHGFGEIGSIHMSINDTGRNPGYCFVDFDDPKTAESAIKSLSLVMKIHGRDIKVGPCQPKQNSQRSDRLVDRWGSSRDSSNYNNYNNYNNNNNNNNGNSEGSRWSELKKGTDARNGDGRSSAQYNNGNGNSTRDQPSGKRLYIGNLGPTLDEEQDQQEIGKLLQEAKVSPLAITKRIAARDHETNQAFCFVDFATAEEATKAINALNGKAHGKEGNTLRVSIAHGKTEGGRTRYEQRNNYNYDRNGELNININGDRDGNNTGYRKRQTADDGPPRALGSNNWRRKD